MGARQSMAMKEETQVVIVIRHGERLDNVDYRWVTTAKRPYDPPLTEVGVSQAKDVGDAFKEKNIQCIVSSPFIRCLQTAQQICDSLALPGMSTCNGIVDVLNSHCGIHEQPEVPDKYTIDEKGVKVLDYDQKPLPQYPEKTRNGLRRFTVEYNKLADKYWPQNIVIVSHGYGVCQAAAMTKGQQYVSGSWADYCGYVEMSRTSRSSHNWTPLSISSVYSN